MDHSEWFSCFGNRLKETLDKNKQFFNSVRYCGRAPLTSYTFGAGPRVKSIDKAVIKQSRLGSISVDVVDGKLPFLVGRQFLKTKKGIMDFGKNELTLNSN